MPNNLHHANLLVGREEESEAYLKDLLGALKFSRANNPDYLAFRHETFGITEARELRSLALRKAFGERKIFFISSSHITPEAQNALLKTFEDPTPDTLFFLRVREEGVLLPTLLSRMQVKKLGVSREAGEDNFLALPYKERLNFVRKFVDAEKNLSSFLDELLLLEKARGTRDGLEKLYNMRKLVRDNTALPRLVLEHLALVL